MDLNKLCDYIKDKPDAQINLIASNGKLRTIAFSELHSDVVSAKEYLQNIGVKARDCIGIYGDNCYAWLVIDIALVALNCVSVALATDSVDARDIPRAAHDYQLKLVIEVNPLGKRQTSNDAEYVVFVDESISFSRAARLNQNVDAHSFPDEVFTIVFSSGTSGATKGVLVTKKGVENTVNTSVECWNIAPDDNILLSLPFSNFQQRWLAYAAISVGCCASMVQPERMFQKMRQLRPTIIVGPPAFYEFAEHRMAAETGVSRWPLIVASLLRTLLPHAWSTSMCKKLCSKWNYFYGDRVRLMFVGSAPVKPSTLGAFKRLGLPLFQAYGMTEFGWIAFNLPGRDRLGSAGAVVEGIELKFFNDGELLVHHTTPQSIGYVFHGTEEQNTVFGPEGFLVTGDICRLDKRNFLYIEGRKKNIITTRSGVKISPESVEKELKKFGAIAQAMVYAVDDIGSLAAIAWRKQDSENSLAANDVIAHINESKKKHYTLVDVRFTNIDDLANIPHLLTRNKKLNRRAVLTHYAPIKTQKAV